MGLQENELNDMRVLALLHDIGKVAIDRQILIKPDKLSEDEWEEVKRHSAIGYRIARIAPTPGALVWELGALTVVARQVRAARAELERV
jgi:HD-GYP domain-containing protein (c-di-GMP phosphodiesterase class II)